MMIESAESPDEIRQPLGSPVGEEVEAEQVAETEWDALESVARVIANAAGDWEDLEAECEDDNHALGCARWQAYISEAAEVRDLLAGFRQTPSLPVGEAPTSEELHKIAVGAELSEHGYTAKGLRAVWDAAVRSRGEAPEDAEPHKLVLRPNPEMPSAEKLAELFDLAAARHGGGSIQAGLQAVWRHGCDTGMVAP